MVLPSSFRPVASIKVAVTYGFGNMVALYAFTSIQVGNGAGNLQDTAVGAGGKLQTFHGHAQKFAALGIKSAVFAQMLLCHLGIAVYALNGGETLSLDVTGTQDTFADYRTGFSWCCRRDFLEGEWQNLTLYVYAVK